MDTTTETFMQDVIEASKVTTILVDFWAPWCGPCKQLTPILEKAVTEAKGRVKLVKLNIDDHPAIPGQMGIQSVPAVVAFKDGRPVDGFMGVQPESQIKAFIEKNGSEPAADPIEEACTQANGLLDQGEPGEALQIFGAILQQYPDHVPAMVGLGNCFLALEELERARGVLDAMPEEALADKDAQAFKASLELAEQSADLGDLGELQAKLDANPDDNQARFDLAIALNGKNKRIEALDHLITIIKNDRDWNEDGARKQLLQFFESWGVMDPASVDGRRKLSSVLFS
nr:thioredoxin [Cohaesibacter sp. ES.047]